MLNTGEVCRREELITPGRVVESGMARGLGVSPHHHARLVHKNSIMFTVIVSHQQSGQTQAILCLPDRREEFRADDCHAGQHVRGRNPERCPRQAQIGNRRRQERERADQTNMREVAPVKSPLQGRQQQARWRPIAPPT